MNELIVVVAAALIDPDDKILLAQRPEGKPMSGLWEFPGGKIETGETPEKALIRELSEELGIIIAESDLIPVKFVSFAYQSFHLLMPLYLCRNWLGDIRPAEGQSFVWVEASNLHDFPAPEADIPLFDFFADTRRWSHYGRSEQISKSVQS